MVDLHPAPRPRINRHHQWASVLTLVAVTVLALLWTAEASAENTVTLEITSAGPLTAIVREGALYPIAYSGTKQQDIGTLSLLVSDGRGTSKGWSVSISASDFDYLGDSRLGRDIPSSGFRIVTVETPTVVAGQARGDYGPHTIPVNGLSLDTPRTVIWAAPGGGSGDYAQQLMVELDIPAGSQPGFYVATLTVAYTSAP